MAKKSGRASSIWGVVFGTFVFVLFSGLSIAGTVSSIHGLGYATRSSGIAGNLLVQDCYTVGTGKDQSVDCAGLFTATTGTFRDADAVINSKVRVGSRLDGQEDPADSAVYSVGVVPVGGWLVLLLVCLEGLLLLGSALVLMLRALINRLRLNRLRLSRPASAYRVAASPLKVTTKRDGRKQLGRLDRAPSRAGRPWIAAYLTLPALIVLTLLVMAAAAIAD